MLLWENKNVSTKKILLERLFELASTEYQKKYKNKLDTICKNNNMNTDLYEMPEIWNKIIISSVNLLNLLGYSINDFDEDAKLIAEHKI